MHDFDYEIERLNTRKDRSAHEIVRGFFKLSHRLEKAVEAIEDELGKLEKADLGCFNLMKSAWGKGSRLKDVSARISDMAISIEQGFVITVDGNRPRKQTRKQGNMWWTIFTGGKDEKDD